MKFKITKFQQVLSILFIRITDCEYKYVYIYIYIYIYLLKNNGMYDMHANNNKTHMHALIYKWFLGKTNFYIHFMNI